MAKYDIMDVSEHQNSIDWSKAKDDVNGVIIRIGYGDDDTSQDDKYAVRNMDECERLGIPYGVYLYSYANSTAHIASEIAHMQRMIKGRNVTGGIWLDLEVRNYRAYWRQATIAWMKAFPEQGGVYSWQWAFTDVLQGVECRKWICAYGSNNGYPQSDYKPTIDCDGWQYTSRATVAGVSGNVDMSEWYVDFAEVTAPTTISATPSVTRQDIVDQMIAWEGYSEKNYNYTHIINKYNNYLPTAVKAGCVNYEVKYTDEWCATCASAAYIACGAGYMFPVECSCPRMVTLAKQMGIWQENDGYVPQPGDAVLYDWEDSGKGDNTGTPDHIGIVIAVDKSKGTFVVMEGNKDESVERRTMSINGKYIRGFVTPKFSDNSTIVKEETKTVSKVYEVSKTGTPNKTTVIKWGILKNGKRLTARLQPLVTAKPCSFSLVQPFTKIEVCDYITTDKRWAYCRVNGKYGFILSSSITEFLRYPNQSIDKVVDWILAGDLGNNETRVNALKTLGYDSDKVQDAVNERLGYEPSENPLIRLYAPRFWENNSSYYGDETIFVEGKELTIFDTGMNGSLAVSKAKALNPEKVTIVITHPHGDHTGNVKNMVNQLPVKRVYFPNVDGIRKYQASYAERMDTLAAYCKKKGVTVTWVKMGDSFSVGSLKVNCIFQANADKLTEKDNHHFINNMSMVYKVFAGAWRILIGGDLSAEGIVQMMASGVDFSCDGFKFNWHGDRNGIKTAFAKALKGVLFAFTQYEHKEGKGNGRTLTYNLLRDIGAFVVRAFEDGEIYIDMQGTTAKVTTSKGITRTFVKKN